MLIGRAGKAVSSFTAYKYPAIKLLLGFCMFELCVFRLLC